MGSANDKVRSPTVKIEATPLDISALIQATAARTYDVVPDRRRWAVPRARERGLDLAHHRNRPALPHLRRGRRRYESRNDSPIKSVADLKGRKIGVYSLGSAGITLIRIALADVHGFNVSVRGGDVRVRGLPAAALPAALASGRIDAATLIHAQAFKALCRRWIRRGSPRPPRISQRCSACCMVSAMLSGYGDELDAKPKVYKFLRMLHPSMDYEVRYPAEVFPAMGRDMARIPRVLQGVGHALLPTFRCC